MIKIIDDEKEKILIEVSGDPVTVLSRLCYCVSSVLEDCSSKCNLNYSDMLNGFIKGLLCAEVAPEAEEKVINT